VTAQKILGLAGNVAEWTSSGKDAARVVRGGSFETTRADDLLGSATVDAATHSESIGFRCVVAPQP
jgi:hypothetical protein